MSEPRNVQLSADPADPIAVLCAMEEELVHLRLALGPGEEQWQHRRRYWLTTWRRRQVVMAICGIGMASAAAATEALILTQRPAAVLNYGCAGAHTTNLLPGDMVIGARVAHAGRVQVEADGTERFLQLWYLRDGESVRAPYLAADPRLLAAAVRAAATLEGRHESWPTRAGWPAGIAPRAPRHLVGTVASADCWTCSPARIAALAAHHESLCEDMEAAAIAQSCATHETPFLTIKDISNNELLRASGEHFMRETEGQLGRRAARLLLATLHQL
jgi:adenosylhomocysteine nucleosidase